MQQPDVRPSLQHYLGRAYRFFREGRRHPTLLRYGCAVFWTSVAVAVRWALDPILGTEVPFALFAIFVLIVAWGNGYGPALFALVSSVAISDYLFVPPIGGFGFNTTAQWFVLFGFLFPTGFAVMLIESLFRAQQRLASQKAAAEEEAERRRRAELELEEARRQLRDYAIDLEATVGARTAELNEAVRFLERFCYSIAHDLRAPLRAMTSFSKLLLDEPVDELRPETRSALNRVVRAAARMDHLITSLLEYGQLSHETLALGPVDLRTALNETLATFKTALLGIGASVTVDEQLGTAWADRRLLDATFRELIDNAIRFADPTRPLHLQFRTEQHDKAIRLWICDNGQGIAPKYQKKIFGAFQTLNVGDQEHPGIGLAIVAKAVERLHGTVGVESVPGVGSQFWIDLPQQDWRPVITPRPERALTRERPGT